MTEPVTPKAERRVIDGEVVDEAIKPTSNSDANARRRAHNRSGQNKKANPSGSKNDTSSVSKPSSLLGAPWLRKTALWGGSLAVVVATLYYTRPDMDWQIEHINRLQAQVAQLHETNQLLVKKVEQQQQDMEARITEVLNRPENQPLISQGDLDQLKSETQQQLSALHQQLQTELASLAQQTETRWQSFSEQAQQALQPTDQQLASLAQLEKKIEQQFNLMGSELSQLFDFKDQQLQQNERASQLLERVAPLNHHQIQQWMVEINNQWLLKGDLQQTQHQLLALEQALNVSELHNTTELARTLGQDLQMIQLYAEQTQALNKQALQDLADLKALVGQIPVPAAQLADKEASSVAIDNIESAEPVATDNLASSFDRLLEKFSGLVSLKKRESADDLSSVEELLMHDVLIQRLALLIDRVQWALTIQSSTDLGQAAAEVNQFVEQHFSGQKAAFAEVLTRMLNLEFAKRQPLALAAKRAQKDEANSAD